ncbi:Uncharacterised protein [Bordetella ansorpii]|uniref:Uncharacterized protein n=1 Tax=Bordetella ansorpii TaxID=288768 RepID=A0A157RM17_9BORD|nr:hypothetical protein [Bordetella ansorpii]SAI59042.1 Uncharacterised protein [Bordetella ansorpii]
MTDRIEPTRAQLEQVLHESRCKVDLDTALKDPTLRKCLINGAEALARKHQTAETDRLRRFVGKADWRARAAGDS